MDRTRRTAAISRQEVGFGDVRVAVRGGEDVGARMAREVWPRVTQPDGVRVRENHLLDAVLCT